MQEIWLDITGYEGLYQVSNYGHIKSLDRYVRCMNGTRFIKGQSISPNFSGRYGYFDLSVDGIGRTVHVHRLVALHFVQNPDNKSDVNHIDFDRRNNRADNLEWVTQKENIRHSVNSNRNAFGSRHGAAKLTEQQVLEIRSHGKGFMWLAKKYNTSYSNIKKIRAKKIWTHI